MVLKLYLSHTSGNMEIKKNQEMLLRILNGRKMEFELFDISDPGQDGPREFMRANAQAKPGQKFPLPPQIFNEDVYCGGFDEFHEAVESEALDQFLKLEGQNGSS